MSVVLILVTSVLNAVTSMVPIPAHVVMDSQEMDRLVKVLFCLYF